MEYKGYGRYGGYGEYEGYEGFKTRGSILKWLLPILMLTATFTFFGLHSGKRAAIPTDDKNIKVRGEGYSRVYTEYDSNGKEITDLEIMHTLKLKGHYYVTTKWSGSGNSGTPIHDPDCTHESHNILTIKID